MVWVLSQLHDFVKVLIYIACYFKDIGHETVSLCQQSLVTSSNLVGQRSSICAIDGQLFLVHHFLILEVVNNLDYTPKNAELRTDIGGVTGEYLHIPLDYPVEFLDQTLWHLF